MAVGPTLGTGLFIGAGEALAIGGPASLLISYVFLSLLTYFMATTVAEVAIYSPSRHGSMVANGFRYLPSSLGLATATLRWYSLALLVPYETTTAMVNLGLWKPGSTVAIRLFIITCVIVGFNFLPERTFRGTEQLFTRIKIGTMIFLLVLSLSIGMGGATGHDKWGFQYWRKPGAMNEYVARGSLGKFFGLLQCLLHSSVAFTFTPELIVHRAETPVSTSGMEIGSPNDPDIRSELPRTVVYDVATTAFPYILSSLAMGVMAPYNEPLLSNNGAGAGLSPFVIGINTAKIRILPVTVTVVIFLSSVASGRSFLHYSARTLVALSELGHAPKVFSTRNQWGVPYVATIITALFALLAFMSVAISSSTVLTYFLVFVNSCGYLSWMVSCVTYRRFRHHLHRRGQSDTYRFSVQPMGTYIGFMLSVIMLLANGLVGGPPGPQPGSRASRIVAAYFSIPAFGAIYLGHRFLTMAPYRSHAKEVPIDKDVPEGPTGAFHIQQGQPATTPETIELEQVWSVAVEA
jgi:amino acid permease